MSFVGRTILFVPVCLSACGLGAGCRDEAPPPATPAARPSATRPASRPSRAGRAVRSAGQEAVRKVLGAESWRRLGASFRAAVAEAARELAGDPQMHVAAGVRALLQENYALAAECFYRALGLDPARPSALRGLAVALAGAERYDEAADFYEMVVALEPENHDALFDLAVVQSRILQFGRAEKSYRRLLDDETLDEATRVKACYNLATLYQAQGKLTGARDTWRQVVRRAPHLAGAHTQLGQVLMDLNEPAGAMTAYAEAAKLTPNQVGAWLNLAAAARSAGSFGRAAAALGRAERLAPADATVLGRKGDLMIDLHRATGERKFVVAAVAAWRRSLRLDPTREDVRDLLATYEAALREVTAADK